MKRVPQRPPRQSTIRFTGPDGVTWQGDGDGYAAAVRDLVRKRRAGPTGAATGGVRWRLTTPGEA